MKQKAQFVDFCENELGIEKSQAQRLYEGINQNPLGFKSQLHVAWPDAFEAAPETGKGAAT